MFTAMCQIIGTDLDFQGKQKEIKIYNKERTLKVFFFILNVTNSQNTVMLSNTMKNITLCLVKSKN